MRRVLVLTLRSVRSKTKTRRKPIKSSFSWEPGFERISEFDSRPRVLVVARSTAGLEAKRLKWCFPSQESLRDMLVLLNQYGYRGFNRFLVNPSSARAHVR